MEPGSVVEERVEMSPEDMNEFIKGMTQKRVDLFVIELQKLQERHRISIVPRVTFEMGSEPRFDIGFKPY